MLSGLRYYPEDYQAQVHASYADIYQVVEDKTIAELEAIGADAKRQSGETHHDDEVSDAQRAR